MGVIGSVAARELGIAQRTLARWTDQGRIKAERTVGGWRLYQQSDVLKLKQELSKREKI